MGMYDTVYFKNKVGSEIGIQFKNGHCMCANYIVGQKVPLDTGIYFGHEGAFVVNKGVIVLAFDAAEPFLFDKWGGNIEFPKLDVKTTG